MKTFNLKIAALGQQCAGKTTAISYIQHYLLMKFYKIFTTDDVLIIKFADTLYDLQHYFSGSNLAKIEKAIKTKKLSDDLSLHHPQDTFF
ncbi:hypothetical protein DEFDS_P095 (plasmid) [Deferribacter desulfuricans SSM1]|uniref:Uncharacterized protein n=1 Tax=Deferribacter desulfuricans (strain DSM 14783 / JCM 11476 / NBRC 101012 / SSM1) TaxID=639282 RepID=D3PES6_DEFDS|nr:hypothetical protein [Deferribacter desulfuricans]BAI81718.1 hypothetical protein DEFDS_P095 [Deferribacter desulfuricans SSM1]